MMADLIKDRDEPNGKGAIPHLSHSRINRYLTCPEQYRRYYLDNLRPKVPAANLVFGNIIHQTLAHFLNAQGDPVKCFLEMWLFLERVPLDYGERESWVKLKTSGEALLRKFIAEERPKLKNVSAVERAFKIMITGLSSPFVGIIDLVADVADRPTVIDFKTSASSYDSDDAAQSDQLTAYYLAEPGIEQLALCVLVKTKEPKIEWHFTSRSGEQLADYLAKVGYVAQEIAAGRFYKRPGMWCAWCDYRPLCVGNAVKAEQTLVKLQ